MVSGGHHDKKQTRGTRTVTETFDPGLQTTSRLDLAWIFETSKPTSSNIHPPARVQLLQKTTPPNPFQAVHQLQTKHANILAYEAIVIPHTRDIYISEAPKWQLTEAGNLVCTTQPAGSLADWIVSFLREPIKQHDRPQFWFTGVEQAILGKSSTLGQPTSRHPTAFL